MYGNGGPIIMVQLENEYGASGLCDKTYLNFLKAETGNPSHTLKKPCRGFYVSQNTLPTSFEIDQIQNIIDIGN
jgi:beta-galactosidase GanA